MSGRLQIVVSDVTADYFRYRGLRRHAGVWSLWGLGVSGVITGEFSGWNYGLITGGFGGLLIATLVVVVMYVGLCFSLSEMASAMPFSGGAYAYGRCALGVWGGCLAGIAQNIEYVASAAATVVSVGDALDSVIEELFGQRVPDLLLWAAAYAIFTGINIYGIRLTCRVALLLAILSLGVLGFFAVSAIPHFDMSLALDVPPADHASPWLPNGMLGIARSVPFAVWFIVVIELLTLTPEEAHQPGSTVPKAILYGLATLIAVALLVLFLNSSVPPGAKAIGDSAEPLLLGFSGIYGSRLKPAFLALLALSAYIAAFHAMIYAYGRSIFSFARAGYIPRSLSFTHATRNTPHRALIVGGLFGFAAAALTKYAFPDLHTDAVLLNVGVFAAVQSYVLQMLSFLRLRRSFAAMERPYVSPLGATGAMTALIIALAAAVLMFENPSYRPELAGCIVIYAIWLLYFVLHGRRRLVKAPEEAFALAQAAGAAK